MRKKTHLYVLLTHPDLKWQLLNAFMELLLLEEILC